jgi:two-component system response regulator FlrC
VHNARACYAAVAEDAPDLILLDIQMPEISGMEALAELKTHHPRIPILMVSASTVQEAAREAKEKGAEDFLLKPFEPEELMQKVNTILNIT